MRNWLRTRADGLATGVLERIGTKLWGFRPNLMKHFVARHGALPAIVWFAKNMPKYEKTLKLWGPIKTHLVATAISTLNGCPYCTFGHSKAFQMHYLREQGQVFPLDEEAIFDLHNLHSEEIINRLITELDEVGLTSDATTLRRMFELYDGTAHSVTDDDRRLEHLIEMFAELNVCGIESDAVIDQIHDPINRDIDLRERYQELRSLHT